MVRTLAEHRTLIAFGIEDVPIESVVWRCAGAKPRAEDRIEDCHRVLLRSRSANHVEKGLASQIAHRSEQVGKALSARRCESDLQCRAVGMRRIG
jgi:hypothetical protein